MERRLCLRHSFKHIIASRNNRDRRYKSDPLAARILLASACVFVPKSSGAYKDDACEPSASGDKRASRYISVCINVCAYACNARVPVTNRRSGRRFVVNQSVNCISGSPDSPAGETIFPAQRYITENRIRSLRARPRARASAPDEHFCRVIRDRRV